MKVGVDGTESKGGEQGTENGCDRNACMHKILKNEEEKEKEEEKKVVVWARVQLSCRMMAWHVHNPPSPIKREKMLAFTYTSSLILEVVNVVCNMRDSFAEVCEVSRIEKGQQ